LRPGPPVIHRGLLTHCLFYGDSSCGRPDAGQSVAAALRQDIGTALCPVFPA